MKFNIILIFLLFVRANKDASPEEYMLTFLYSAFKEPGNLNVSPQSLIKAYNLDYKHINEAVKNDNPNFFDKPSTSSRRPQKYELTEMKYNGESLKDVLIQIQDKSTKLGTYKVRHRQYENMYKALGSTMIKLRNEIDVKDYVKNAADNIATIRRKDYVNTFLSKLLSGEYEITEENVNDANLLKTLKNRINIFLNGRAIDILNDKEIMHQLELNLDTYHLTYDEGFQKVRLYDLTVKNNKISLARKAITEEKITAHTEKFEQLYDITNRCR